MVHQIILMVIVFVSILLDCKDKVILKLNFYSCDYIIIAHDGARPKVLLTLAL